jgi:hypothetical protein
LEDAVPATQRFIDRNPEMLGDLFNLIASECGAELSGVIFALGPLLSQDLTRSAARPAEAGRQCLAGHQGWFWP